MPTRMPAAALIVATTMLAVAGTARAQTPDAQERPSLAAAAAAAAEATPLQAPPAKDRMNPVAIGTLIGAGGAAALTAVAAAQYGANEGGRFCIPCLAQWGMITVPVGAGIGAGIGWIVKAASPDPQQPGLPPTTDRTAPSGWRQDATVTIRF